MSKYLECEFAWASHLCHSSIGSVECQSRCSTGSKHLKQGTKQTIVGDFLKSSMYHSQQNSSGLGGHSSFDYDSQLGQERKMYPSFIRLAHSHFFYCRVTAQRSIEDAEEIERERRRRAREAFRNQHSLSRSAGSPQDSANPPEAGL